MFAVIASSRFHIESIWLIRLDYAQLVPSSFGFYRIYLENSYIENIIKN